jgi:hypothetical protein
VVRVAEAVEREAVVGGRVMEVGLAAEVLGAGGMEVMAGRLIPRR